MQGNGHWEAVQTSLPQEMLSVPESVFAPGTKSSFSLFTLTFSLNFLLLNFFSLNVLIRV